jgi:5'-nucleotidase
MGIIGFYGLACIFTEDMKPRILLTNDDGISSAGLWAAYQALSAIADVTIVAPAAQQSAVGRSISIFEPIRADEVTINGIQAVSVSGKPTDAVIIGLYALRIEPTLVVSGINIGENLSYESIMTSGTVGAALEAANQGAKSIAFSLQVENQGDKFEDPRFYRRSFDHAGQIVRDICQRVLSRGFPHNADVINVNIPSVTHGGYEITRLAPKLFMTGVEKRLDPRGRPYYWINGPLMTDSDTGTDVHAISRGAISITPITLDCTADAAQDEIRQLFID